MGLDNKQAIKWSKIQVTGPTCHQWGWICSPWNDLELLLQLLWQPSSMATVTRHKDKLLRHHHVSQPDYDILYYVEGSSWQKILTNQLEYVSSKCKLQIQHVTWRVISQGQGQNIQGQTQAIFLNKQAFLKSCN